MSSFPVTKDSYLDRDYYCTVCEKQSIYIDADFYCKKCVLFFCGICIKSHKQHRRFLKKQSPYGRDKLLKWPLSRKMEKFFMTCDIHTDEQLKIYCQVHNKLCCSKCVVLGHRECRKVTPISELTDTQSTALQRLSVELETVQREINSLLSSHEAKFRSLHGTFKEHQEFMIEQMRYNINTTIDYWGHSSLGRSDGKEQYIKEKMCMSVLSILNEFDNSSMKELKEMEAELKSIHVSITSSINKCTGLQNDLKQFYEIIQKIWDNKEICFIASMKCEHKIQKALSVLGKSGKMFTVQGKSEHTVSDSDTCVIIAICVLPDGQVLLADWDYKKVKLLDQQYQVVSHLVVQADPKDMCLITPSEVAVTVDDNSNTHEVQFITVTKSQLVTGRKFQLQHECKGIAHHLGDLFICSGTALHKYSLSGKLVLTLYEDISSGDTVSRCAVSPTGDKLYIANRDHHDLLTLARDGTLLATFTDPELDWPRGLHVTPAGQILVCGGVSNTILQVDREGRNKLATLVTENERLGSPCSVCYSSATSSIIVGRQCDNKILVFRVE